MLRITRVKAVASIFLAAILIFSGMGAFGASMYWVVEDDMDYSLASPFKSDDIPLFVGQSPDNLPEELIQTGQGMLNTQSFRIPSLLWTEAASKNTKDTLLALVDRASGGSDWGKIDLGIRRSTDNGESWSDMELIVSMPSHKAPQADSDWQSSFCIDPAMIQADDGSVVLIATMFPESKGLHNKRWLEAGNGHVEIDSEQYMALYAEDSNVGKSGGQKDLPEQAYTIRERGWVYTPDGERTNYYVPQLHSAEFNYETIGDMYYAVGTPDYLTSSPPLLPQKPDVGDESADIYVGNIYLSYEKPEFSLENPQFVEKTLVAPWKEGGEYSAYEAHTTSPAPLRASVTSYVWMFKSHDNGVSWEQPVDITPEIKIEKDEEFLGVCPGVGLILKNQSYAGRINRLIFPLYKLGQATIIYSDDQGKSWQRAGSEYIENVDEVQCVELQNGSILAFGRQTSLDKTPVSISLDGGQTWQKVKPTELYAVKCQKSLIMLPFDKGTGDSDFIYPEALEKGRQYVLASHPSGDLAKDSSRTKGVVTLGLVNDDHSISWLYQREIKDYEQYELMGEYSDFFAYSCLSVLDNGNIGLLYEAYPAGYLTFTQFNLDWIIAGHSPARPSASRFLPLIFGIISAVLLMIAGFVVIDVRRRRRLMPAEGELDFDYDEGYDSDYDNYDEEAYEENEQHTLPEGDEDVKTYQRAVADKSGDEEDHGGIYIADAVVAHEKSSMEHDNIPIGVVKIGSSNLGKISSRYSKDKGQGRDANTSKNKEEEAAEKEKEN